MKVKTKLLRVYSAAVLALTPLFAMVPQASAEPGAFSLSFDGPSVSAGQQDVPVYIHLNSNGTDVSFAGCRIIVDTSKVTFSHATDDNGAFTSDFAGPNGDIEDSPTTQTFFASTASGSPIPASSDIEVMVFYYDVLPGATGTITFDLDESACVVDDENSSSFTTVTAADNSLNVSGVSITPTTVGVTEGGANDTFDVVLDAEPGSNVTITVADDAETNVDSSSLIFGTGNWDAPQTVTVSAEDDSAIEGAHTGTISVSVAGGSDPLYTSLSSQDVTANITDDDGIVVEFDQATGSGNEGDSGSTNPTFELLVSGGDITGGGDRYVDVSTSGGTATGSGDDYSFTSPTTVTIPEADYTTPATVTIPGFSVEGDTSEESDETVDFSLSNPTAGVVIGDADGDLTTDSTHTYTINNDDGLLIELSSASASDAEGTGGNIPTLLVTGADLSGGSETVVVTPTGTATGSGDDYTLTSTTVTIPAADYTSGTTSVVIGLSIDDNAVVEADETIILTLSSPSAGSIGDADMTDGIEDVHTYTITNDDSLQAELTTTTATDAEASGANVPQILINGTSDVDTSVTIDDQASGTATSGTDYSLADPVVITVPSGTYDGLVGTAIAVPLSVTDDQLIEGSETVVFDLSTPESNISLFDIDTVDSIESTHTYTITDDDQLTVEFDVAAESANEDDGYSPVIRYGGAVVGSSVQVDVAVTGGTATGSGDDYTFTTPTTVIIPVGDYSSATGTSTVSGLSVVSDGIVETDETIEFTVQNPGAGVAIGDADTADGTENVLTFTITNDDALLVEFTNGSASDNESTGGNQPQVVVSGADTTGGSDASIEVTVTGGSATSGAGNDYTFTDPETVTIPAGNYTTAQTLSLSSLVILDDAVQEANETIDFSLNNPLGGAIIGDADGDLTTDSTHTYTINNDDGLLIELSSASASDAEGTGGNIPTLLVTGADLSGGSETVVVTPTGTATGSGDDYTLTSTTVTIPAADYTSGTTSVVIGLSIDDNAVVEADETIILTLSSPSAGSIGDADMTDGIEDVHTYTITNDDFLGVQFSSASASDAEASGGNVPTVFVSGTSDVAAAITVDDLGTGSATASTDYTFSDPTVLAIPAGSYDGTTATDLTFTLTVSDDSTIESNETIIFDLVSPTNAVVGANGRHTYTITNDDTTSADSDNDGIADSVEDAGPNSGDANGDGTQDSAQTSVSSIVNSITGEYNVLEITSGCSVIDSFGIATESSQTTQDGNYDYPFGLKAFQLTCGAAGESGTVTIFLDAQYDTSDWTVRKLNTTSGAYTDLTGVTFGTRTVGSNTVTTVSYTVTDGESVDEDGVANAVIVDPIGIGQVASEAEELSETGANLVGAMLAGLALIGGSFALYQATRRYAYYTIKRK